MFLFPEPVEELRKVCDETGTVLMYDGAHVSGLIAGGQFQNPLQEGAHVFNISTHKTIPGDQGGVIMTNDQKLFERVASGVMPGGVSNHHLHRIAPLIVTLREVKEEGRPYANQVVRNAVAFAHALAKYGLEPEAKELGYTASHQVALNVRKLLSIDGKTAEKILERNSIYANHNGLPRVDKSVKYVSGIRTGVQEITLQGMREDDMDRVAWFYKRALVDTANVASEVKSFAIMFPHRHYAR